MRKVLKKLIALILSIMVFCAMMSCKVQSSVEHTAPSQEIETPVLERPLDTEQDEPEQNEPEQNEPEQNEPEQNEPEQNEPEQNEPEQDEPIQNEPEQDEPVQNDPEQDEYEEDVEESAQGEVNSGLGNTRQFLYTYDQVRFERFSGFNKIKDAKMLEYADQIMNGILFVSAQIEGMPYENLAEIDWNVSFSETPNSYMLYLQGLTPLEALGHAYRLTADEDYLEYGMELIRSWLDYSASTESVGNVMVWNDHGTAIRAESLLYFMLISESSTVDTSDLRDLVYSQLVIHAEFLASDAHYTENHNHGIFQDQALLHIAYFIEHPDTDSWIEIAESRLLGQKEFAFNSEMVHVENSTGYSEGVLALFLQIANFLEVMNDPVYVDLSADVQEAAEFLGWTFMPNGIVSAIGDTNSRYDLQRYSEEHVVFKNPRLNFTTTLGAMDELSEEAKADVTKYYPDAGYFFYRENWDAESCLDTTWKMFKAGYSTRTHKHADDTSFMLYSKGYEIFTDPGYYNYMSGTPYRTYFVSSSAHNVVTVDEKSYSPTEENAGSTGMLSYDEGEMCDYVLAFNDMYLGVEMDRHFYSSGDLTVLYDNILSGEEHTYSQLFHLAENIHVVSASSLETVLSIADTGYFVRIRQMIPAEATVYFGETGVHPLYGHISRRLNEVQDSYTLAYVQEADNADFITVITIEDENGMVALKDGRKVNYADITYDAEQGLLTFSDQAIVFEARERLNADVSAEVASNVLTVAVPEQDGTLYAWYILNARTAGVLYKSSFSKNSELTYDLSGLKDDIFIKLYVRASQYDQRKSAIVAALVYNAETGEYELDEHDKYPDLNLQYYGHHVEQLSDDTYRFTIDYDYSWTTTQRWYVYRNGSYYTVKQTSNQPSIEFTFAEAGSYTVSYYLRTPNGNCEYWDFKSIVIDP